ncbi:MAG: methyltransferase [Actinomycetota bacterium]|nr:methyltransferase [Actinomycetota bacterium]MDQ3647992.1 methyltransferase [Actinomycetota bacterium]
MTAAPPELRPTRALAEQLGGVLRGARYNTGGLMVALGGEATTSRLKAPVQDRRLGDDRLAQLARLFLLGVAVEAATARQALAPADLDELAAAGLVHQDDGAVRGAIRVTPYAGLLLAHDSDSAEHLHADVVTGVNQAARTLASLTPREEAATALDIGTGNGLQALLAAVHSDRVVATDVNARALSFTQLSATLSGLSNVEVREGSLYEPVQGESFDLVVCNPPYVISPDTRFAYRDGGMRGDELTKLVLSAMPEHLNEGGLAQMLGNWVHGESEEWSAPAKRWLDGRGCDVLLLHHASADPLDYAETWIKAGAATEPRDFPEALDRWTEHFAELGIERVASGAVTLRKRAGGANWTAELEMPRTPVAAAGDHVLRLIDAQDLLREGGDQALARQVFVPLPDHRIERVSVYGDDGYGEDAAQLIPQGDAGVEVDVDDLALALLRRLDGERTLVEVEVGLTSEIGAEPGTLLEAVLVTARSLYERGLVKRISAPGPSNGEQNA